MAEPQGAPLAGGPANGASAAATRELCNTPHSFAAAAAASSRPRPRSPPLPPSPSAQSNQIKSKTAHGADVILGVRNVEAGQKIAKEIM